MRTLRRRGNLRAKKTDLLENGGGGAEGILHIPRTAFNPKISTQSRGILKAVLLAVGTDGKVDSQDCWMVGQDECFLPADIYED
jgi:hypothetical protein